jgi:hypothetical protein
MTESTIITTTDGINFTRIGQNDRMATATSNVSYSHVLIDTKVIVVVVERIVVMSSSFVGILMIGWIGFDRHETKVKGEIGIIQQKLDFGGKQTIEKLLTHEINHSSATRSK